MKLSNKTYDILKWIAQIFIPALITLYGTIAVAIGIPYTEIVITVMGAIDAFLGTLLGISTSKYNDDQEAKRLAEFEERKRLTEEAITKIEREMDHGSSNNT